MYMIVEMILFYGKLPEENLINLNIAGLKKGDTLVVEDAHLRESHRYTLAQPFNFEQLTQLKENAEEMGIILLLFPQKSTPKTRKLAGCRVKMIKLMKQIQKQLLVSY